MLNTKNVIATIAVKDLGVALKFYEGKLGLKPIETDDKNYISYKSGDTNLLVYKSKFAGDYKATVATWEVGDEIDDIVIALKNNGVSFEHYELPDTTRVGDVHVAGNMKMAWCKDPDGNILCLVKG